MKEIDQQLEFQIKETFSKLKIEKRTGFLVTYKDYNDGKVSWLYLESKVKDKDWENEFNQLMKDLIDRFSLTYTKVISILDISRDYALANVSCGGINGFIEDQYSYVREKDMVK